MAGGASSGAGRQPRNRHDVNDPLLLAPRRADQQPPLGAGLSVAAATVSAVGSEKNGTLPTNGKVPGRLGGGEQVMSSADARGRNEVGGRTSTTRLLEKKENERQTPVREPRTKLV